MSLDWSTGTTPMEAIVKGASGTELFLACKGPARTPGQPVVIFEAGMGASSSSWAPVQRLLDSRIRSYRYDRAGYGRSPAASSTRSASTMAAELLDVLASAGVEPPYILVAHSYGGIVAREVLAAAGSDAVVGMVLVDANQENTHKTLREPLLPLVELAGPDRLTLLDMTGLLAGRDHYTPEELSLLTLDAERESKVRTMAREMEAVPQSSQDLADKKQLEMMALMMRPVSVIRGDTKRDYRRVISATQQAGVHGEARRELSKVSEFVDSRFDELDCELQRQQMLLSASSRFVQASGSGHAVIATEPKLVADEVSSLWESCMLEGF
ncbi:Alpha/Beta hydrolase protein [Diaporthe sp. PMI_573]|nr:Alpha/Beta hydrolase protein [Diaporthaceae sp. PMI_573]